METYSETSIQIRHLDDTTIAYCQIINLIHDSFKERLEQGLNFSCSLISEDEFKAKTCNGVVLVAVETLTEKLVGTATINIEVNQHGEKYGYFEYLAIDPQHKRTGIGSLLLKESVEIISHNGIKSIYSDTAITAKSSVRWHNKNGFHIIGIASFPATNYYSFVFVKNILGKPNFLRTHINFIFSCVWVFMTRNKFGEYRPTAKLIRRLCHKN